jgi:hypothetical protein
LRAPTFHAVKQTKISAHAICKGRGKVRGAEHEFIVTPRGLRVLELCERAREMKAHAHEPGMRVEDLAIGIASGREAPGLFLQTRLDERPIDAGEFALAPSRGQKPARIVETALLDHPLYLLERRFLRRLVASRGRRNETSKQQRDTCRAPDAQHGAYFFLAPNAPVTRYFFVSSAAVTPMAPAASAAPGPKKPP